MRKQKTKSPETEVLRSEIDEIVRLAGTGSDRVVSILHAIQDHYRWLPREALRRVCEITDITPAQITGVSTFYSQFRHRPVGRYTIKLCFGTACYVRGAPHIADTINKFLSIAEGDDTDPQRVFTVEKVACLGCCSLAPCMMIQEVTYGHLTPLNTSKAIGSFLKEYGR